MAEQTQRSPAEPSELKRRLGRTGVWLASLAAATANEVRGAAGEIERLGYPALWVGETPSGREAFTHAALLLSATERLQVATGIANVYARDAVASANAARTLSEAWGGRFVLGLGVSHAPLVTSRGHDYSSPYSFMRDYLDGMDRSTFAAPIAEEPPRLLAALRGKMLELAARRAQGAHPYFVTPEHTARAREILGSGPVLAPEQAVVLETDPSAAREIARDYASAYLAMPNYTRNLLELGFSDDDFRDGGSDALVDAIVAWGDEEAIAARVRAHHEAGADHVCVQPLAATVEAQLDHLRALAPALLT
ncbi:LLM class F420-dependent oxidoreductase [Microbispora corallina]|uniref:LLM class F420-dependent oxidoreductase n=1 Tax=Microbispora corallina TaxID=83302 RepID=A0ABQ4G174_9ACTN|nr:TIGR03620 family F420-dependent LLM class oxidoreductase [Microbispora corallina]GIH40819.1 LLM class F420-dependent oxidoreductase [Microbispora corallina]